ncbi:MAG: hypothetical protein DBY25_05330 [Clostridiales bacterium]|nr:MAG: hypothetical protein DBY25_05330 [Clostridiales bacterium]
MEKTARFEKIANGLLFSVRSKRLPHSWDTCVRKAGSFFLENMGDFAIFRVFLSLNEKSYDFQLNYRQKKGKIKTIIFSAIKLQP